MNPPNNDSSWPKSPDSPEAASSSQLDPNTPLILHCPDCNHPLRLSAKHLGVAGKCVSCGLKIMGKETSPGTFEAVQVSDAPVSPTTAAQPTPPVKPVENSPAVAPKGFSSINPTASEKDPASKSAFGAPTPAKAPAPQSASAAPPAPIQENSGSVWTPPKSGVPFELEKISPAELTGLSLWGFGDAAASPASPQDPSSLSTLFAEPGGLPTFSPKTAPGLFTGVPEKEILDSNPETPPGNSFFSGATPDTVPAMPPPNPEAKPTPVGQSPFSAPAQSVDPSPPSEATPAPSPFTTIPFQSAPENTTSETSPAIPTEAAPATSAPEPLAETPSGPPALLEEPTQAVTAPESAQPHAAGTSPASPFEAPIEESFPEPENPIKAMGPFDVEDTPAGDNAVNSSFGGPEASAPAQLTPASDPNPNPESESTSPDLPQAGAPDPIQLGSVTSLKKEKTKKASLSPTATFGIVIGIVVLLGAGFFFVTPASNKEQLRYQLAEWLEPGAVVIEKLPFGLGEKLLMPDPNKPNSKDAKLPAKSDENKEATL